MEVRQFRWIYGIFFFFKRLPRKELLVLGDLYKKSQCTKCILLFLVGRKQCNFQNRLISLISPSYLNKAIVSFLNYFKLSVAHWLYSFFMKFFNYLLNSLYHSIKSNSLIQIRIKSTKKLSNMI